MKKDKKLKKQLKLLTLWERKKVEREARKGQVMK
jgi:hypothetical protein